MTEALGSVCIETRSVVLTGRLFSMETVAPVGIGKRHVMEHCELPFHEHGDPGELNSRKKVKSEDTWKRTCS
jgi:hypothetical protein